MSFNSDKVLPHLITQINYIQLTKDDVPMTNVTLNIPQNVSIMMKLLIKK